MSGTEWTDEQISELDFEAAQAQLEEVVARLEGGQLPLEEALALYQLGVRLRDQCRARLAAAETLLERLQEAPDGSLQITESEGEL